MTRKRWITFGSIAVALGGLSWLAKIAVIIATDGKVDNEGAAALFYLLGVALMMTGSTAVGVLVTGHRSRLMLIMAVVLSPIVFLVSFAFLEGVTKPLLGERGPAYFGEEVGIMTTGLAWLMIGVGLLKAVDRSHGPEAIVRMRGSS